MKKIMKIKNFHDRYDLAVAVDEELSALQTRVGKVAGRLQVWYGVGGCVGMGWMQLFVVAVSIQSVLTQHTCNTPKPNHKRNNNT